ncbi:MFS multidrug transporter [Echria macrotheca]|uniref:MFS multidrug transporter n=1 Tax=Echria macrotheca TaxID=438768 RepID=A0AAJ0B8Y2_9PEZI|nr:MFS multidrug transporter [Echria macrotheca]
MRQIVSAMQRVPTTRQVLPGASVNIVLKADQPTGRTVTGVVQDVLTRGNHPRGIKVRLIDGRVGRVQTMAAATAQPSLSIPPEADALEEVDVSNGHPRAPRQPRHLMSQRNETELPTSSISLDAYIKPAKQRRAAGKGKANRDTDSTATSSTANPTSRPEQRAETSSCPVCGNFEGDPAAVAHHVASHFDD